MSNMQLLLRLLPLQLWNTVYMVFVSGFFACLIGIPVGILLTITAEGHIKENRPIHKITGAIVNIVRSFPFAVLPVVLIPITRKIVGTGLGTTASLVPLTIAAAPFLARLIENNLREIDFHLLEAAVIMGSDTRQIITGVLFKEALPSIISSITLTLITLVGYSAMAGLVGGGGLGQIAIQYGYQRFNPFVMIVTVLLLIGLVQTIQWLGNRVSFLLLKKRGLTSHE